MPTIRKLMFGVVIAILISTVSAACAPVDSPSQVDYPSPVGYVNDFAQLLTGEEATSLSQQLSDFEQQTGHEIAVVTVPSLQGLSIEEYTLGLANSWGVGKEDQDNGVVLLVAPNERKVRIQPGTGLESVLNATVSQQIIDNEILPAFKVGHMSEGIINGTTAIMEVLNQSTVPGNSLPPAPQPQKAPSKPIDWDGVWSTIQLAILFIAIISSGICLVLWIAARSKKNAANELLLNQAEDLLTKLRQNLPTAEKELEQLKQNNPKEVWDWESQGFQSINIPRLHIDFNKAKLAHKKGWFAQVNTTTLLDTLIRNLSYNLSLYEAITGKLKEVEQARRKSQMLRRSIPTDINIAKKLAKHQDVNSELSEQIEPLEKSFEQLKTLMGNSNSQTNWIDIHQQLRGLSYQFGKIINDAQHQIDQAKKARQEGPKLLKQLPEMLDELENKYTRSSRARAELAEARQKLQQAQAMANDSSGPNWVLIYLLLLNVNSHSDRAQQMHRHDTYDDSRRSSSRSDPDTSFDVFGGGGFTGGGGATGSW